MVGEISVCLDGFFVVFASCGIVLCIVCYVPVVYYRGVVVFFPCIIVVWSLVVIAIGIGTFFV